MAPKQDRIYRSWRSTGAVLAMLTSGPVDRLKGRHAKSKGGSATGYVGPVGSEDFGDLGADAWFWHSAAHPASVPGPFSIEPGYALSCFVANRTARLDCL